MNKSYYMVTTHLAGLTLGMFTSLNPLLNL